MSYQDVELVNVHARLVPFVGILVGADDVHPADELPGVGQLLLGVRRDRLVVRTQQRVDRVHLQDAVLNHERRLLEQGIRDPVRLK